ncbi:MAG: ATP-grasp fold amidoligase family protein [Ndongobacter sp.]|nr:ATP-grasp fold amidoligase family protein [Ndongobacter sp.]
MLKQLYWRMVHILAKQATKISPYWNTRILYRAYFKRKWEPDHPVTLNDKVLWLKYHDYWNNETVKRCADKYLVRDWIREKGCPELLNELIAVYESPEDIDFAALPNRFAMKLNTGCACNFICSDKSKYTEAQLKEMARAWFRQRYYLRYAEFQYKDVRPYILIEEYLGAEDGSLPEDYKFYCFHGESKYVMLCDEREIGKSARFFYYDREWNKLPLTQEALDYPEIEVKKPALIEQAFAYAEKLSEGFPFVRADFYIVNDRIYFGEMTFTPSAGLDRGRLPSTDLFLGKQLSLDMTRE